MSAQAMMARASGAQPQESPYAFGNLAKPDLIPLDTEVTKTNLNDLPEMNDRMQKAIHREIRKTSGWTFGPDGLPFMHYNGDTFQWNTYKFPVQGVNPYPREGHIPIVQRAVKKFNGTVDRYAVAARYNTSEIHGYRTSVQGLKIINMVMEQLVAVAVETISHKVMRTFLNVSNHIVDEMIRHGMFNNYDIGRWVRFDKTMYGVISFGGGAYIIALNKNKILRDDLKQFPHDHTIEHPTARALLTIDRPEFYVSGERGPARFENGPDAITTYQGNVVNVAYSYRRQCARQSDQVLAREDRRAEFYPSWRYGSNRATKGVKANDGISIYNEATDAWTFITMLQMLRMAVNLADDTDKLNGKRLEAAESFNNTLASAYRSVLNEDTPNQSEKLSLQKMSAWYSDPVIPTLGPDRGKMTADQINTALVAFTQEIKKEFNTDAGSNVKFFLFRDNITRTMATSVQYQADPGRTMVGEFESMMSGDSSNHTFYFSHIFKFGTFIESAEMVHHNKCVAYLDYIGGKDASWVSPTTYKEWLAMNCDTSRAPRGSLWCTLVEYQKPDETPNEEDTCPEHTYVSLVGDFAAAGAQVQITPARRTAFNGGLWPSFDVVWNVLGLHNLRRRVQARVPFGAAEPPASICCLGHVQGVVSNLSTNGTVFDTLVTWSTGDTSYDDGDGEGMAAVRRGETTRELVRKNRVRM